MHRIKKIIIATLIFCNSIYSQEVKEEQPKKKWKEYAISGIWLGMSLSWFNAANGYKNASINAENTRSDIYSLAIIGYGNQPQDKLDRYMFATLGISDSKTTSIEHNNNAYQSSINNGMLFGLFSALSFYYEYRIEKSNNESSPKSMITPILNLNSKSAEIGVSITF